MKIVQISIYPGRGEKHSNSGGVASYTKNLLTNLPRNDNDEIFVLCEKINEKHESYLEDGITVIRCFDKKPIFLFQLLSEVRKIRPDVIHVQQELGLFGNIVTAYLLQWLLFLLRKYRLIITLHGVVSMKSVTRNFVRENNSNLPAWMVKMAFYVIYKPLCAWAKKVVVHERLFRDFLVEGYGVSKKKISIIPHGVEDLSSIKKEEACEKLSLDPNKNLVLFMGYLTGYKGIDLLLEGFSIYAKSNPNAYLVVGSGKHPKLKDNQAYNIEYERLQQKAENLIDKNQYRWDGFIEESAIVYYYSACDISVYPYTVSMSSSGPMAIAIGFEKPFLASDVFEGVIDCKKLLFKRTPDDLMRSLNQFFIDRKEFSDEAKKLKSVRLWPNVGDKTWMIYSGL